MRTTRYEPGRRWIVALLVALALGAGCDIEPDDDPPGDPCDEAGGTRMFGGDWVLTGSGSRGGCEDERLNAGTFRFRALPFRVGQYGRALELEGAPAVEGGWFRVANGYVRGRCVQFSTVETYRDGLSIKLDFTGTSETPQVVTGQFEGVGPEGCFSQGTFRLEITCCAGDGPDAPPPDVVGGADVAPDAAPDDTVGADTVGEDAAGDDAVRDDAVRDDAVRDDAGSDDAGSDDAGDAIAKPRYDVIGDGFVGREPVDIPEEPDDAPLFGCAASGPSSAPSSGPSGGGRLPSGFLVLLALAGLGWRRARYARRNPSIAA